ncbi:MAG: tetratricopeptide repeat protein [Planctomycetaceae bacterium]|nr:tetratricopeptide repeat protein [Planctomycetaceae bacterium]
MPRSYSWRTLFLAGMVCWLLAPVSLLQAAEQLAPTAVQAELDRRAELLNQIVAETDLPSRIQLIEQVRTSEQLLLEQKSFPPNQLQQLLDEHIGLLSYLVDYFEFSNPQRTVQLREEVLNARRQFHSDPDHWEIGMAQALLAESRRVAELEEDDLERLMNARTLYQKGTEEFQRENYGLAARFQEECLVIYRKHLGEEYVSTAIAYRIYGRTLIELERGAEAAEATFHAAQIARKVVGPSPLFAGALADCASGVYVTGDVKQAAKLQERAVRETERVVGQRHEMYATAINNQALYLSEVGDPQQAYLLAVKAGQILASLGNLPEAQADNSNLTGTIAMTADRHAEAYAAFLRAIKMQTEQHGPDHFYVAVAYGNASQAAMKLNQIERADQLINRSIEIVDFSIGRQDPRAAAILIQKSTILRKQGRMKEAVPLVEQAIDSLGTSLGKDHPQYAKATLDLAVIYYETGHKDKAEQLITEAAEVFEQKLGPNSIWLSKSLSQLAVLHSLDNHRELAEQAIQLAGTILVSVIEKENPEYAEYLQRAATVYENAQDVGLAKSMLNELTQLAEKKYGAKHPEYAMAITALGTVLLDTEEKDRGKVLLQESEKILVDTLGRTHPEVLQAMTKVARASRLAGDPEQALKELVDIEAIVKKQLGPENEVYSELLMEMGRSYLIEGDKKAAEDALVEAARYYINQRGQESPAAQEALELIRLARTGDTAQINAEALRQLEKHLPEVHNTLQKADQIATELNRPESMEKRLANLLDRLVR